MEQFIEGHVLVAETGRPVSAFSFCANEVRGYIAPGTEQDVFRRLNGRELSVTQDSQGKLRIPVYRAARYAVIVRAPGFAQWLGFLDAPATDVAVRLEPEAFAAGRVVDSAGVGVAGAIIVFDNMTRPGLPPKGELQRLGRTDADGNFEVGGLPAGPVPLTVVHPDFENTRVIVTAARGAIDSKEISMRRAGAITGKVFLDGAPCAGAGIQVNYSETIAPYGFGNRTGENGRYEVTQLPMGAARIRAVLYSSGRWPSQNQDVTVDIVEGARIEQDFYFKSAR